MTKAMKILAFILLLLVSIAQAQPNITKMEYFIGIDPGFDMANSVAGLPVQPDITNFIQTITPNLNQGINYIGYRSKDANNVWSHTNFLTLYVVDSTQSKIAEVEYFWDVDSGFNTHSDTIFANPVADISNGILYANVPLNLGLGTHIIFVRSKDTKGRWSHTNYVDSVEVIGTVSITDLINQTVVSVYPNPFTDEVIVSPKNKDKMRIVLYNETGQLVYSKIIEQETRINTQTYAPGAYTIIVWAEKQKIYRSTVIKQ